MARRQVASEDRGRSAAVRCRVEDGRVPADEGTRHLVDLTEPARRPASARVRQALSRGELPAGSAVSLEPGGQLELSTRPVPDVATAIKVLRRDCDVTDGALAAAGLVAVSIGAGPPRPLGRIYPGDRYTAMAEYFSAAGYAREGAAMMTATASLQVNVAADPRAGWAARVVHLYRLCPPLTALSAEPAQRRIGARLRRRLHRRGGDLRCRPRARPRPAPVPAHDASPGRCWGRHSRRGPVSPSTPSHQADSGSSPAAVTGVS